MSKKQHRRSGHIIGRIQLQKITQAQIIRETPASMERFGPQLALAGLDAGQAMIKVLRETFRSITGVYPPVGNLEYIALSLAALGAWYRGEIVAPINYPYTCRETLAVMGVEEGEGL